MTSKTAMAKLLLESGVVTFRPDEPFKHMSGILAPMYMDHRVLLSQPEARKKICKHMDTLIKERYRSVNIVVGQANAGIPWAAWLAAGLNLPMAYVRKQTKRHGQKNRIEGTLKAGSKAVIIEDVINTGGGVLRTAQQIRQAGSTALAVITIFSYEGAAIAANFKKADVPYHTLTDFPTLLEVATTRGYLSENSAEKVLDWAKEQRGWGKRMGFKA